MSCGLERIDLLFAQELAGVSEAGPNVLFGKVWVALKNLGVAPAGGKQVDYELDRNARAAHDWLPGQDLRINDDTLGQRHFRSLRQGDYLHAEPSAAINASYTPIAAGGGTPPNPATPPNMSASITRKRARRRSKH